MPGAISSINMYNEPYPIPPLFEKKNITINKDYTLPKWLFMVGNLF